MQSFFTSDHQTVEYIQDQKCQIIYFSGLIVGPKCGIFVLEWVILAIELRRAAVLHMRAIDSLLWSMKIQGWH